MSDDGWGDIILVNGVPWPERSVQPRAYRFRVLNIGITRTYTFSMDAGGWTHTKKEK
jgi:FtsP/CotA-like multicopper oxidase with cupredoxin domain